MCHGERGLEKTVLGLTMRNSCIFKAVLRDGFFCAPAEHGAVAGRRWQRPGFARKGRHGPAGAKKTSVHAAVRQNSQAAQNLNGKTNDGRAEHALRRRH